MSISGAQSFAPKAPCCREWWSSAARCRCRPSRTRRATTNQQNNTTNQSQQTTNNETARKSYEHTKSTKGPDGPRLDARVRLPAGPGGVEHIDFIEYLFLNRNCFRSRVRWYDRNKSSQIELYSQTQQNDAKTYPPDPEEFSFTRRGAVGFCGMLDQIWLSKGS